MALPSEDGYREGGIGLPRMVIGKVTLPSEDGYREGGITFRGWL